MKDLDRQRDRLPDAAPLVSLAVFSAALVCCFSTSIRADDADKTFQHFLWSKAHRIPAELTSEESGYFSIVEGRNQRIYVGTAKYGDNAYLVEFDPATDKLKVVVDAEKEIGEDRKGFAAQAKFHTRNNVGRSGRIYLGTKQGYAYIVRFSNGEVKEIIQGADVYIAPGTQVDIIAGADGWKLVPRGGY